MELSKDEVLGLMYRVISLAEKAMEKAAPQPVAVASHYVDPFAPAGDSGYPSPEPLMSFGDEPETEAQHAEVQKPKLSPFTVTRGFGRTRKPGGQGDVGAAEHELGGAGGLISTSEREALDNELWEDAIGDSK